MLRKSGYEEGTGERTYQLPRWGMVLEGGGLRTAGHFTMRGLPAVDALFQAVLLAYFMGHGRHGVALVATLLIIPFSQWQMRRLAVYDSHRIGGTREVTRKVLSAQLTAFVFTCLLFSPLSLVKDLFVLASYFIVSTAALILTKAVAYTALQLLRRRGFDARRVCMISTWERAQAFCERLALHPEWGLQITCVGLGGAASRRFVDFPGGQEIASDLRDVLKGRVVDEVILAVQPDELAASAEVLNLCEQHGLIGRAILETWADSSPAHLDSFCGEAALSMSLVRWSDHDLALKRIFDLVVALLVLLLTWPLFIVIAIVVKLSSPGPVFFRQTRVGLNGRQFQIIKFRTMLDGADSLARNWHKSVTQGPIFKDPNDYRITGAGRILRRFSLDEMPQLFSVLKGEMSIVGPRPLPVREANEISGENRRRFSVLPGLTGLWQVNGRSMVGFDAWMKYDLQYVDKRSLWLDTVLLLRTIPAVLSGRGAY
jgi:exopolysaccharide biosynthesis polyprenyl glycosylphosphotransferase